MRLWEREGDLTTMRDALGAALDGHGRVVAVEGQAGIGKSRLLEVAMDCARDRGLSVHAARAGEFERLDAFGLVRQLLDERTLETVDLTGPAALAGPALLRSATPTALASDALFAVLHGLQWIVEDLAARSPRLLVADDVHWADGPSLAFIDHLARRIDDLPVVLVLGLRLHGDLPDDPQLTRLLASPRTTVVRLAPLSAAGTRAVVEERLGQDVSPELVDACHDATSGVPFLLDAVVQALAASGTADDPDAPARVARLDPPAVIRSVADRLSACSPAASATARAVAVLGAHATRSASAELAGLDDDRADDAVEELVRIGILSASSPLQFAHPILRGAAYRGMTESSRQRLHRRAIDVLRAIGAPAAEIAAHLLVVEPRGDARSLRDLRDAARTAAGQGAWELAAACLRRARQEAMTPVDRAAVALELGRVTAVQMQPESVAHLSEAMDFPALDEPELAGAATAELVRVLLYANRAADAVALADRAERLDPQLRLRIDRDLLMLAQLTPSTRAAVAERLEALVQATASGQLTPPEPVVAHVATELAVRGRIDAARDLARAVWRDGLLLHTVEADSPPAMLIGTTHLFAESFEEALAVYDVLLDDAGRRGSLRGLVLTGPRGLAALRRGDIAGAEADALRCLEAEAEAAILVQPDGEPVAGPMTPVASAVLVLALIEQGRLRAAREALAAHPLPPTFGATNLDQHLRVARGSLRLADGDHDGALEDLLACGAFLDAAGIENPAVFPWAVPAARALAITGRRAEALEVLARTEGRARRYGLPVTLGSVLRARAVLTPEDARDLLAEAVDLLEQAEARLECAHALACLGRCELREDGPRSAQDRLLRALEQARRTGARALVDSLVADLRGAGIEVPTVRRTSLTPAERRVAELAAEGMSNRDIAEQQFLSMKTVEMHLTRTYRKLGIRSRSALGPALGAQDR